MQSNNFEVALTKCYFCGGDNQIVMNRVLTKKHAENVKEMHGKIINKEPCNKCAEYMKKGVILISVRDDDPEYRTGGFAVVTDEGIRRAFPKEQAETLIKMRAGFIADSLWEMLGLPKE